MIAKNPILMGEEKFCRELQVFLTEANSSDDHFREAELVFARFALRRYYEIGGKAQSIEESLRGSFPWVVWTANQIHKGLMNTSQRGSGQPLLRQLEERCLFFEEDSDVLRNFNRLVFSQVEVC